MGFNAPYQRQSIHHDESRSRHLEPSRATAGYRSIVLLVLLLTISLVAVLPTGFLLDIPISLQLVGSNGGFHYKGIQNFPADNIWVGMKAGEHCLRYATRQYTARISQVRGGDSAMKACKETPVEIHGKVLFTDFCQDLGFWRGVWGFWVVGFGERECETEWGEFTDLGCIDRPGLLETSARRIESVLENLQPGSNWQIMCATTPANIDGHYYGGPAQCLNLGSSGVHGAWDISDASCP